MAQSFAQSPSRRIAIGISMMGERSASNHRLAQLVAKEGRGQAELEVSKVPPGWGR